MVFILGHLFHYCYNPCTEGHFLKCQKCAFQHHTFRYMTCYNTLSQFCNDLLLPWSLQKSPILPYCDPSEKIALKKNIVGQGLGSIHWLLVG